MVHATNKQRPFDRIWLAEEHGGLNCRGTFMVLMDCALEDVGLTTRGPPDPVRQNIKALAEVYASRPFSHIEVSARALERIWQQCCKDERDFEQFYLDMWSQINNGSEAHVQEAYGVPLWIELEDESSLDTMHMMAEELDVVAISENRLGNWEISDEEPDPHALYCDVVEGDK
ncbi:unnamed protein product [Vitrella brassicaformis CCMP3155]|uniref:Uncharacterized protein n=1 Tax=Vitrella brassicaformis (strain CCMP3155) TaxID=1169540 RepID=A0A0G4EZJ0_VITBC|nr:unnamed protein product [Vitrella brassicaformis CCMP3155]|eukprot:CEM04547.1 unnamed protein product [Vitrella brassicaformis CCMP3155]